MSTAAIATGIRDARESETSLRIAAAGTWLRAGGPVRATRTLSVSDDRGIVEYVPGDLTLTARAGTPLADLVAAVKANGQWLPLDPWGGDAGSVGATISTATAGPHAHSMGLPRDVALGLEFVSGAGDVIRAGGRVVKNVAGFDLTRLLVGSWGTLGVITEVTLRLRARPAVLRSFAVHVPDDTDSLNRLAVSLRELPFTPIAAELVNGALAERLRLRRTTTLLLRLGGNARSVDAQVDALRSFAAGKPEDAPLDIWRRLRLADDSTQASWRRSALPSAFGDTWTSVKRDVAGLAQSLVHGSPFRGVVRVLASGDDAALAGAARRAANDRGTFVAEVLPGGFSDSPPERAGVVALERRIRTTFDPAGILNPGILGADA